MSVIVMRDEINQVCDALYWDAMGRRQIFYAVVDKENPFPSQSKVDDERDAIAAWGNRVYIANQLAYILTYSHRSGCDRKIDMIDRDDWKHGGELVGDYARFYRILESIKYNLWSNGGQVMLCREDMERLDNLIAWLARECVGQYQKGKVTP